ncbi:MAG TPA: hypothetical protein VMJ10_02035, partial [Kofleriaceae bacterium]|nr:hypothetical protein [Kofleriaceae bacterium]
MWRVVFAGALAGCNSLLGIHDLPDDGGRGSGTIDGGVCYGSGGFTICLSALPAQAATPSGSIDTDSATDCPASYSTPSGNPWCVIAGSSVTIGATLRASGSRPLVLVSTGVLAIELPGVVDVSSHIGNGSMAPATVGAASDTGCASGSGASASVDDKSGGGGAGGSYATGGGQGGAGDTEAGGPGGATSGVPTTLVGGCSGGYGGAGDEPASDACKPTPSDPPGAGGGAVYLVAGDTIQLDGVVMANGAGGGVGNQARGGGAGGGAGGLVVLWAGTAISGGMIAGGSVLSTNGGGG